MQQSNLGSLTSIEQLYPLFNNSPVAVYLAGMDGKIVFANNVAQGMLGYTLKEFQGMMVPDLDMIYTDQNEVLDIWNTMESNKPICVQGRHKRKDGQGIDVEVYLSKVDIFQSHYILGNVIDITDRLEKQRRIAKSEFLLKQAQNLANIGHWELNFETGNLEWSDEVFRIFEKNKNEFVVNYENFLEAIHPDDKEPLNAAWQEAVNNQKPYHFSHRILMPNGDIKFVEERAEFEFDESGVPLRAIGTIQDITELVRAKDELDKTYEKLTKLAAQVPGVVYQYRLYPDGRSCFPYSSAGMWDIYEHTPEEVKEDATPVFKRLHPDDIERISKEIFESAEKQTLFHSVFRVVLPQKGVQWRKCDARPELMPDGSTLWYGIITDITDRVNEHEALIRSEERYRIVADNTYHWEFWEDETGRMVYVSPSCKETTGYTADEFYANNGLMGEIIHPHDKSIFQNHRHGVRQTPHHEELIFRIINKEGEVKHIRHVCRPALDSKGNLRGIRGTNLDVTESVLYLQKIENLLKIEEEQNKRLRDFTHIVSHNIRSHSANIEGLLNLLKLESPQIFEHPYLKMMSDSSANLSQTITHLNQVLDVSRVSKEVWMNVNLFDCINRNINGVITLAKNADVQINNLVPADASIKVVPAFLDSIVLNLITNAIKFKSPDRSAYLTIKSWTNNGVLFLSFEDNGLGIDLEMHRDKIFGMYKTFHRHKDSKGLGLFLTRNHVEALGGTIEVQSTVNKGTTFLIKLPYEKN